MAKNKQMNDLNEDKLAILSSNLKSSPINTINGNVGPSNNDTLPKYIRTRKRYLNIDSRDRDLTLYPDANSYTVDVSKESFSNIAKIELVSSHFLNVQQLVRNQPISLKNNVIKWNVEDDIINGQYVVYSAEIDPGNYTAEELAKEIENKMNAVPRINGESQYFKVYINTVGDLVSITSINFKYVLNPFNFLGPVPFPRIFTVNMPNHGFEVGDKFWIYGSEAIGDGDLFFGKLPPLFINLYETVLEVIDENTFTFEYMWVGILDDNVYDAGGENVQIGKGINFRLLFALPNTPAEILGFKQINTDFDETHFNIDLTNTLNIAYILPIQNGSLSLVVTQFEHNLKTNDRVFVFDTAPSGSSLIFPIGIYDHTYFVLTALTPEDEQLRLDYVEQLTTSNGFYITVIDEKSFSIAVPYGDYKITEINPLTGDYYYLSEYIEATFVPDPTPPLGGAFIVSDVPELVFTGEPYFYITSNLIGGDFATASASINDVVNVFAKVYLAGDSNDDVYNSFVGGKKTFYNSVYNFIEKLDLKFQYPDGSLVDFLNTEHSLVLRITEVIQKVEGSEFNSKIGLYEYTSSKNLINPPSYYAKF